MKGSRVENPNFFIDDIKSIEFNEKNSLLERSHISFRVIGVDKGTDLFGNKSTDPYTVYFKKNERESFKELYEFLMKSKREKSNQSSDVSSDIPEQIKKLSDLRDSGILTEEEFNSKKKDLLDKL